MLGFHDCVKCSENGPVDHLLILELQVHPHVRRIDDLPICAESQQAWVISLAAMATTPDGSGGMAVGCTVI